MVTYPGDPRVKVQVGWIIQQLEMLDYIANQDNPDMDVLRREIKFLLTGVIGQWTAEREQRPVRHMSNEELLKEFGW